jgi:hypothetical protein
MKTAKKILIKLVIQLLSTAVTLLAVAPGAHAQTAPDRQRRVYGEVGLGFGQTLFFGDLRAKLRAAIGAADFTPNRGGNYIIAFYVAPDRWRGLGLGARGKVFGAGGAQGDSGEEYFFNYYHTGISAKYYPLTRQFNKGLYVRASYGPGQLTAKRDDQDEARTFRHQFAVGSTLLGGVGYTLPLGRNSLSFEVEVERARRNGTISGVGDDQVFRSGQVGANVVMTF